MGGVWGWGVGEGCGRGGREGCVTLEESGVGEMNLKSYIHNKRELYNTYSYGFCLVAMQCTHLCITLGMPVLASVCRILYQTLNPTC